MYIPSKGKKKTRCLFPAASQNTSLVCVFPNSTPNERGAKLRYWCFYPYLEITMRLCAKKTQNLNSGGGRAKPKSGLLFHLSRDAATHRSFSFVFFLEINTTNFISKSGHVYFNPKFEQHKHKIEALGLRTTNLFRRFGFFLKTQAQKKLELRSFVCVFFGFFA